MTSLITIDHIQLKRTVWKRDPKNIEVTIVKGKFEPINLTRTFEILSSRIYNDLELANNANNQNY